MLPTMRMGRRIRRTSRNTQERQAEINQILQETLSGHMVVKAFDGRRTTNPAVSARRPHGCFKTNVRYVLQQALSSPVIDMLRGAHDRRAACATRGCRSRSGA